MRRIFPIAFVLIAFISVPFFVSATLVISEIMYDLPGSDSGREWIEIKNASSSGIDLSEKVGGYQRWRVSKSSGNHQITPFQGGDIILPGDLAIIALDPLNFLKDWPNFSGVIFKSSFISLSNTGESVAIKDTLENISVGGVTYSSEWGSDGNGNSLQLINGSWKEVSPTPGEINMFIEEIPPPPQDKPQPPTPSQQEVPVKSDPLVENTVSQSGNIDNKTPSSDVEKAYTEEKKSVSIAPVSTSSAEAAVALTQTAKSTSYPIYFGFAAVILIPLGALALLGKGKKNEADEYEIVE